MDGTRLFSTVTCGRNGSCICCQCLACVILSGNCMVHNDFPFRSSVPCATHMRSHCCTLLLIPIIGAIGQSLIGAAFNRLRFVDIVNVDLHSMLRPAHGYMICKCCVSAVQWCTSSLKRYESFDTCSAHHTERRAQASMVHHSSSAKRSAPDTLWKQAATRCEHPGSVCVERVLPQHTISTEMTLLC